MEQFKDVAVEFSKIIVWYEIISAFALILVIVGIIALIRDNSKSKEHSEDETKKLKTSPFAKILLIVIIIIALGILFPWIRIIF